MLATSFRKGKATNPQKSADKPSGTSLFLVESARPASCPGEEASQGNNMTKTVIIMGAAGRDFHVFNTCYRNNPDVRVVAFTAEQIPHIDERVYPPVLAGPLYPDGINIYQEARLVKLIREHSADEVIFAYSDISRDFLNERRSVVEEAGAVFATYDVDATMIASSKPVVAVTAVRTGAGKSQTSRRVVSILNNAGYRTVAIRHPMPYGDLAKQAIQRFATLEDMDRHQCTIEEREEYEPHIANGAVVYAGVDYEAILRQAEQEADVIVWDGGNNDTPFYKPDLWITIADPHRPGHELRYVPGNVNFERADIILINKIDTAPAEGITEIEANAAKVNAGARIIHAESPVSVPDPGSIRNKRVLAVEDGPTLTHGEMKFGASVVAARKWGAAEIVDPRPWVTGEIAHTFEVYPDIGPVLPAMGYRDQQIADLETTINAVDCNLVLIGTPIDLGRLININKESQRVTYELREKGEEFEKSVLATVSSDAIA